MIAFQVPRTSSDYIWPLARRHRSAILALRAESGVAFASRSGRFAPTASPRGPQLRLGWNIYCVAEAYVCLHYGTGFVWLRSATPAEYAARHHAGERARAVRDRDSGRVRQSDLGLYPSDASPDAAHPRVCLHFTPTCTSWLNQVALWIAKSEREAIAHGISRRRPTSGANSSNKSGCATNPVS